MLFFKLVTFSEQKDTAELKEIDFFFLLLSYNDLFNLAVSKSTYNKTFAVTYKVMFLKDTVFFLLFFSLY